MSDFTSVTWEDALREFLLHKEAAFAPKTVRYYRVQLSGLAKWAPASNIAFAQFGKHDLDRYLVERQRAGKSQLTIHHDTMCAKVFMASCQKNDLFDRSRLSEYAVRKAPTPPKYMPTHDDMVALVRALRDYWNVEKNPNIRYWEPARTLHRAKAQGERI